jgi:hypothetical protein
MKIRTSHTPGGFCDRVDLLDAKGHAFAKAWFRLGDEPEDVLDQLEWLARAAREHVEGNPAF